MPAARADESTGPSTRSFAARRGLPPARPQVDPPSGSGHTGWPSRVSRARAPMQRHEIDASAQGPGGNVWRKLWGWTWLRCAGPAVGGRSGSLALEWTPRPVPNSSSGQEQRPLLGPPRSVAGTGSSPGMSRRLRTISMICRSAARYRPSDPALETLSYDRNHLRGE